MSGRVPIEKRVGERVRALREAQGLSQVELARLASTSRSHVTAIERGEKSPTVATLEALAHALRSTIGDLVGERGEAHPAAHPDPADRAQRVAAALRARGPGYARVVDRMVKLLDGFLREEIARPTEGRGRRGRRPVR